MKTVLDFSECVARVLYQPQMVSSDGVLTSQAFPTDELIETKGKSVSLDRVHLLRDPKAVLGDKARQFENPAAGRSVHSFSCATVEDVHAIRCVDGAKQIFAVFEDPIEPAKFEWDAAHAKLVRAFPTYTRGFIRGYRDRLQDAFSQNVSVI